MGFFGNSSSNSGGNGGGSGGVSKVNLIPPDANGNVTLTPANIGAVSIGDFNNYTSQDTLSRYASDVDSKDIYRVIEFKRADNTLYMRSTLSNPDAKGNYQTCTWQYYNTSGTTVTKTVTWTFTYDTKENIVSKVVS